MHTSCIHIAPHVRVKRAEDCNYLGEVELDTNTFKTVAELGHTNTRVLCTVEEQLKRAVKVDERAAHR